MHRCAERRRDLGSDDQDRRRGYEPEQQRLGQQVREHPRPQQADGDADDADHQREQRSQLDVVRAAHDRERRERTERQERADRRGTGLQVR